MDFTIFCDLSSGRYQLPWTVRGLRHQLFLQYGRNYSCWDHKWIGDGAVEKFLMMEKWVRRSCSIRFCERRTVPLCTARILPAISEKEFYLRFVVRE